MLFFEGYCDQRDLHVLTHSFPTRRSADQPGDPTTLNRLYGRAKGKPLRAGQQELSDGLLPQIAVPAEGAVTAEALFGYDRPLHFEIGFGGGEHMAARADMQIGRAHV